MILTFRIVLIVVMVVSLLGVIGEKKDIKLRDSLTGICIASIIAFILTGFLF